MTKTSNCKSKHKERKLISDFYSLIHKEEYGASYYFDKKNMILDLQTSTSEIHDDQSHRYSNLFSEYRWCLARNILQMKTISLHVV